ncbi:hypothetical protein tooticki91_gp055 [Flavobacterium phage vB_FspS_tooticki9-1]|uniref:Uncharacterized protein n=19 Tax=Caudoviricetes TaxID=2731619 RepID=A0A6B9LPK4_9CAUD|nr:hypothetical protein HWC87_gp58 [Flavobacterium phage vB_FspS_filifjonk9-1]YP_009854718.1 hypothetical protein HWC88_gp66 [Flavobacterium phage vB_FspS_hattifnatt9-1]YP_009854788.1 hypothetical protein HWC89_gp60 [Flavobacterium phage vB_FspS_hemulen6-1]YP_009855058.1 hypothetical protein HWC93_gp57 [Flavobacterium phage vB_FspS_mumin9-1]YP_009855126.1 hypothetical protein HWC94_gp58 [Flavobacterium phage vB_FspS_mymlan6-1]YP_009855345.1 hypothetical protein HWC97_gp62 [Flavobacterium phage
MPLYNFKMFIETNDLKYFSSDLKEDSKLQNIADLFFTDYIELTNNRKVENRYITMFEIMRLENKYKCVSLLLKSLWNYDKLQGKENFDKMIDILEQWNYKIDRNKEVFEQIEKIANRIQGIKTKIELLRAKLDDGQKEKSDKPNFEKELINIGRILELRYSLKIKELNVAEFIGYQKQAQEVIESQNKAKK